MSFLGEENFSHEDKQKVGVIICNLGSPDSYSTKDVRKYLREFLSDTRVRSTKNNLVVGIKSLYFAF